MFRPVLIVSTDPTVLLRHGAYPIILVGTRMHLIGTRLAHLIRHRPRTSYNVSATTVLENSTVTCVPNSSARVIIRTVPRVRSSRVHALVVSRGMLTTQRPTELRASTAQLFFGLVRVRNRPLTIRTNHLILRPILIHQGLERRLGHPLQVHPPRFHRPRSHPFISTVLTRPNAEIQAFS